MEHGPELAHLAGTVLLVPGMFEPCGLAPLIGMRYGTVPVVQAVGTVFVWCYKRMGEFIAQLLSAGCQP